MSTVPATRSGWPFWAPSDLAAVDRALDLAKVGPGDVVADLGCGDGRVLVAAARRGAAVVGVECDADLAEQARTALDANGVTGEVLEGDLFEVEVPADVYFTYLAPASLQRLLPALAAPRGTRLVTIDFEVPGLLAHDSTQGAFLYRLPGRRRRRRRRAGWACEGALVIAAPSCQSLTVLEVFHPGGPVEVEATGEIADVVSVLTGDDDPKPGALVAVDLRWDELEPGTLLRGELHLEGLDPFPVTVLFAADDEGCWELTDEGVDNVERFLEEVPAPRSADEIVRAAEGD